MKIYSTPNSRKLLEFRREYPNRWPEYKEEFPSGYAIGKWCDSLRQRYKINKYGKRKLLDWQIEKLDAIGFPWNLTENFIGYTNMIFL